VLSSFGGEYGLDREQALRIACAFAGGMARMGETCGAVTGALMVIGLAREEASREDNESKEETYRLVRDCVEEFRERNGSIVCRELLGVDISTEEGLTHARVKNLFHEVCPKFVRDAAEILKRLLE
jgi:C_GCAxxG_C_C family probable redox protein